MPSWELIIWSVVGVIVAFFIFKNFAGIKKFISEAIAELKKVSWSTREELIDAAWVVLVSAFVLGIYIGCIDLVLSRLLALIIS